MPLLLDLHTEPLPITPVAGIFSLAAFKVGYAPPTPRSPRVTSRGLLP